MQAKFGESPPRGNGASYWRHATPVEGIERVGNPLELRAIRPRMCPVGHMMCKWMGHSRGHNPAALLGAGDARYRTPGVSGFVR